MTPNEKARELMLLYYSLIHMCTVSLAKKCALIAVDAILNTNDIDTEYSYYLEVKQKIEQL